MSNRTRAALSLSTRTIKIYASAYDGTARADISEHLADLANPHGVTAEQIGLGNADNTSDADKPISTAQSDALALKAPLNSPALSGVPTAPTAALGTVTTQVATTAFAYAAANDAIANMAVDDTPLADHLADHANPHQVTKAQVGLALVDNTADAAKPVSTATQTALNAGSAATTTLANNLATHTGDTANPHAVSKAQLGLALVDNTADATKPVSAAQQTAINVAAAAAAAAQADIDGHQLNVSNPHATTKAQIGLAFVDNTADLAKPVSTATQAAINAAVAGVGAGTIADDLADHLADVANPHSVTKTQIGLGAVDNTSDIAKPVSDATQLAINAAVAGADAGTIADDLAAHLADLDNPHAVNKTDVGLGAVDNTADLAKPVSSAQQAAINVAAAIGTAAQADIDGHQASTSNPHAVTKNQVGLGSVDNTADINKPVSAAQQTAINVASAAAAAAQSDIDGHEANVSNPHGVTKSQIGLGNADNTADLAKPVSTATQTALNLKAPLASPALTGAPTAPTAAPATSTTQIASTAFARAEAQAVNTALLAALALKAPVASPALTGTPSAPTAAPLTNTTQLATTAYADAGDTALQPSIDAAADAAADAQAAADAAQADATQALADAAAAQAAADAAQATADELPPGAASHPGDAVALYGETKTGAASAAVPIDPAWVAATPAGNVLRVAAAVADDPQTVTPIAPVPLEPGRIYDVRYRVQRIVDPVDPLNDSVTCGIQWLTGGLAANGAATIDNIPLVIANGIVERTARIGIATPVSFSPPDIIAPAGTIYFRPFVDLYGDTHTTDVIAIDVQDVTAAVACCDVPVLVVAPISGSTVTMTDRRPLYVNNPATLAALTIRLPNVTKGGADISFANPVTALAVQTAAGAAIANAPTNAYGPGAGLMFRYVAGPGWVYWK